MGGGAFINLGGPEKTNMAFGPILRYGYTPVLCRYIPLTALPSKAVDKGIEVGDEMSEGRSHKAVVDNCHTHVADCMSSMEYRIS